MSKYSTVRKVMSALWDGVNCIRKVLHLLILLLIFSIVFGMILSTKPRLPKEAALIIHPVGTLTEQLAGDPYDRAISKLLGDENSQTLVQDIVDGLEYAKDDSRIKAVVLDLRDLRGSGGLSKLQRIGAALDNFRSSGKPVIADSDFYSQPAYYLAAHADEVYMHLDGLLLLPGFDRYRSYFKDAIDKLRIDWNIFKVGTHKSFVEPYMRMDMSREDREATTQLLDQLWRSYREEVSTARGIDISVIDEFSLNLLENVRNENGDIAALALSLGLVDDLLTRAEVNTKILEYVATDTKNPDAYRAISLDDFLAHTRLLKGDKSAKENVAIIVASGEILDGTQVSGLVGGDSIVKLLRSARNDDSVKAVVIRVDSPGGSMFASEIIRNEIEALKAAGIPVVVSMGSVAASGGYWISMAADKIYANAETITGSIGIFGMFPTFHRSFAALGIATDGMGTTPWAGQLRPDRAMSNDAKALFQIIVDKGYDKFISKVSQHRNLDKIEVDRIGQGRVWTGADALALGLIDEIGNLDEAIVAAAELANLDIGSFGQKILEKSLTPSEQLAVDFLGTVKWIGFDPKNFISRSEKSVQDFVEIVEDMLLPIMRFNDPKGVYSHCFCTFE